jgi:uncharacterized membrane protein
MRLSLLRRVEARRLDAPRRPTRFAAHYDPDAFGRFSEGIARFFGTARYLVFQTVLVITWILANIFFGQDYHLFYLNLAFSTQAAYAAPLILLAQNRQAERDRLDTEEDRRRNARVQADAEFLARELMAARLSLGRMESTLARLDEDRRERDEAEGLPSAE